MTTVGAGYASSGVANMSMQEDDETAVSKTHAELNCGLGAGVQHNLQKASVRVRVAEKPLVLRRQLHQY